MPSAQVEVFGIFLRMGGWYITRFTRINQRIIAKTVRLIDENGAQLGIIKKEDALSQALELGLDLVNQLKGIGCIIVDDKGEVHASKNIDITKYR